MNKVMVCKILDLNPEYVKSSKGNFTYFKSFFSCLFSNVDEKMKDKILAKAKENNINIQIIDNGCHYHDFVGGAKSGSAKDSYHYVTFKIEE